jgi:hypothetical protein
MVAMALANRRLDPAQARQRWFKYGTYLLVIATEVGLAAAGLLVLLAVPIVLVGAWELAQVLLVFAGFSQVTGQLLGRHPLGPAAGMAALGSLLGLLMFGVWQPRSALFPVQVARWLRQSLLATGGSAAVLMVRF